MNWRPASGLSALIRTPERIALAIVAGGIVARVYLFLLNRSFWRDEAKLALNVVRRSFGGLLGPLEFDQAAPLGFLWASKAMIVTLGNSDIVLRVIPLLSGCVALYLMYRLSFKVLPPVAALFSLLLFTLGKSIFYFSTDFKQYSGDVAVALALCLLTLRSIQNPPSGRAMLLLAVAGAGAILLSFPSAFVLAAAGTVLLFHYWRVKKPRVLFNLFPVFLTWAGMFVLLVFLRLSPTSANAELQAYWADAFMPFPPWGDPLWLPSHVAALFVNPAGFLDMGPVAATLYLLLALAGSFSILRRNRYAGLLLILPLGFALVASALHQYPFSDRLMLWAVPALILIAVEGVWWLLGLLRNSPLVQRIAWAVVVGVMLASPVREAAGDILRPKARQHVKPLLSQLRSNRVPGDLLYVYYNSRSPFLYYYTFYNLSPSEFVLGGNFHGETERYVQEIASMGNAVRVWILFTHVSPAGDKERDQILNLLGKVGGVVEAGHTQSASLFLFERHSTGSDHI